MIGSGARPCVPWRSHGRPRDRRAPVAQDLRHHARPARRVAAGAPRRDGRAAGRVGLGQVDAAAPPERPASRRRRHRVARRACWAAACSRAAASRATSAPRARAWPSCSSSSISSSRLPVMVNVLAGALHRAAAVARPAAPLSRSRDGARARGDDARGHRAPRLAARIDAVGRPAAARGDLARARAGRRDHPRRRADRLARSRGEPQGDAVAGRRQPRPRRHGAGVAAPGRIRLRILPAHDRAARGPRRVRRPHARA